MSLSPSPPSPPRPPRRQFLFKRANLSAPDSTSGAPGTDTAVPDFFSRREQNYTAPEAVAKKVKPKRPKKKVAADGSPPKRARGDDSAEEGGAAHDRRGGAKQRYDAIVLSGSEDDGGSNAARKLRTKTKPKSRKREVSLTPPPVLYNDPISYTSSAPTQRPTTTTTTVASTQPISLDSDPEDPAPISAEDALFATLEKRAREKAAAAAAAAVPTTTSPLSPPLPDPIISILITSRIEGTQPLVLRIRANQTLKAARTTWCQRQGFTADQAADIFLTWKGNKVFDHNSCRGVGIRPVGGEENIHLEAVTVEGYAAMERERERRYALAGGEVEDEVEEEVEEKEEVVMRLTLRRKGAEDFKIKVRPETKISKLIAAYRIANKVPEEKEIRLDFDGDDLNPEETVDDTELEDLFGIDVYVS